MTTFLLNWSNNRLECISKLAGTLSFEEYQAIKSKFEPKTCVSKKCQTAEIQNNCVQACSKHHLILCK